jgi:hypothetical protein
MTLDNLLKSGRLKRHATDRAEIGDLLSAARRNLADAGVGTISIENRFDAAYRCATQCGGSGNTNEHTEIGSGCRRSRADVAGGAK